MAGIAKIALLVEYEGTEYYGFQVQPNVPTIQGELEEAILKVTGESVRLHGAGRTDTGVHARGQVATFETESTLSPATILKALNFYLPADIAIRDACEVEDGFDARRSALSREYRYTIRNSPVILPLSRRYAYFVPEQLNIMAMRKACKLLVGKHDFAAFTNKEGGTKNTVRTVFEANLKKKEAVVTLDIGANAFLPQQVRRIVGCLVRVGLGEMKVEEMSAMLASAELGVAKPPAPPYGLCLMKVNYSSIGFGK